MLKIPKLPDIKIENVNSQTKSGNKEYLKVNQDWYKLTYPDGTISESFQYDSIKRWINDAAVILAYSVTLMKGVQIYLRSCVRPPVSYIDPELVNMWECAAGLIDPGEKPEEAAARECKEELGFDIPVSEFKPLGDYILPSAGMSSERLYLYYVHVDPSKQMVPSLDGSPLEKFGQVTTISDKDAIALIDSGQIKDAKTEIAIRRFINFNL